MVTEDYITRAIQDMVRALAGLVLGREKPEYLLPEKEEEDTENERLYRRMIGLAENGRINEAENLLWEAVDGQGTEQFEMAMAFYLHLNEYVDEYLELHEFSREEIAEGVQHVGEIFGYSYDLHFL